MSNVDINVDRRTDGRKIGHLYRTLLQAGVIKRVFANSADPDQMLQNVASEQDLHCLQEV